MHKLGRLFQMVKRTKMNVLLEITNDQQFRLAMWIIGGFCSLAFALLVYIGNAGASIKKSVTHIEILQAKHIGSTNEFIKNQASVNQSAEKKFDHLEKKVDNCFETILKQRIG